MIEKKRDLFQREIIDDELIELEKRKLRVEIEQLEKPIWKKPVFWGAIIPALITIIAAYQAYQSGIFDIQKKLIENENWALKREQVDLKGKKTKLESYYNLKDSQLESEYRGKVRDQEQFLKRKTDSLKVIHNTLRKNYQSQIDSYNKEISFIKDSIPTVADFHYFIHNLVRAEYYLDDGEHPDKYTTWEIIRSIQSDDSRNRSKKIDKVKLNLYDMHVISKVYSDYVLFASTKDSVYIDNMVNNGFSAAQGNSIQSRQLVRDYFKEFDYYELCDKRFGSIGLKFFETRDSLESEDGTLVPILRVVSKCTDEPLYKTNRVGFVKAIGYAKYLLNNSQVDQNLETSALFLAKHAPQALMSSICSRLLIDYERGIPVTSTNIDSLTKKLKRDFMKTLIPNVPWQELSFKYDSFNYHEFDGEDDYEKFTRAVEDWQKKNSYSMKIWSSDDLNDEFDSEERLISFLY
ncbi:MAG: hypothetical protein AAFX87_25990 [Bacteroidota bacterium]